MFKIVRLFLLLSILASTVAHVQSSSRRPPGYFISLISTLAISAGWIEVRRLS